MQYNFIQGYNSKLAPAQRAATDLLKAYFASPEAALISTPTYNIPSDLSSSALVIQLFS